MNEQRIRMDQKIQTMATRLSKSLDVNMRKSFLPDERKALRRFSSTEVAQILGVSQDFLRKMFFEDKLDLGEIETDARGRRFYTAEQIDIARHEIARSSTKFQHIVPRRRDGEHIQIISIANFKGGAGKTTTAIHLAQKLALDGYRVLAIDLDPQASMTTMFGFRPEIDFPEAGTVYDALRYEDPIPFRDVVRKTYFHNLDLAAAGLLLSEFETETAHALRNNIRPPFYQRLALCINEVETDYDIVVIDCPPQLGFTTLSALVASTSLVVTVIPSMLDVASMAQFLQLTSSLMATIADVDSDGLPDRPATVIVWCSEVRLVSTDAPVHSCAPAPTAWIAANSLPTIETRAPISHAIADVVAKSESAPAVTTFFRNIIFSLFPVVSGASCNHAPCCCRQSFWRQRRRG